MERLRLAFLFAPPSPGGEVGTFANVMLRNPKSKKEEL
jgi:hypothetical protein